MNLVNTRAKCTAIIADEKEDTYHVFLNWNKGKATLIECSLGTFEIGSYYNVEISVDEHRQEEDQHA